MHRYIKPFYGTTMNAVHMWIWIAFRYNNLLVIAKERYDLVPSPHSIFNSFGQVLFQRVDIRELYNQPTYPVIVLVVGSVKRMCYGKRTQYSSAVQNMRTYILMVLSIDKKDLYTFTCSRLLAISALANNSL